MEKQPMVTVKQGKLIGKIAEDVNGRNYFSFQGIPYAKPPVGKLRFKAPCPAEPWNGVLDATHEGNECFAANLLTEVVGGSEDCLFLNVYTPKLPCETTALAPVMVWIHGGGFVSGSGNSDVYGPEYLIPHDVVIVTLNYRIGLLGFLSFKNPMLEIPGNAGLKDQVLALKWVQENIANFNGDPNNVTIFGESAGAASVHLLMLSPMAQGLFHKAIIQSGSALSFWSLSEGLADALSDILNIDKNNEHLILQALENMNSSELFDLQGKLHEDFVPSTKRLISPIVEPFSSKSAFLLENPIDIITSGKYSQVPLMIGFCSREGMVIELLKKMRLDSSKLKTDEEAFIPYILKIPRDTGLSKEIAQKIQTFYKRNDPEQRKDIDHSFVVLSDLFVIINVHSTVKNHIKSSSQPIYLYRISVESDLNVMKSESHINETGVCHFDDIFYLFKTFITPKVYPESIESDSIHRFTKLWTTFAKTGNPNPTEKDPFISVTWKPVEKENFHFLDIGDNLTVGVNPDYSRMKFWDEISELAGSNF